MQKKGFFKRERSQRFCLQLHELAFCWKRVSLGVRNSLFPRGPLTSSFWCCESVKLAPACPTFCIVLSLVGSSGVSLQCDVSVPRPASGPLADRRLPLSFLPELLPPVLWMALKSILEGTKFRMIAPNNIRAPTEREIAKLLKITPLVSQGSVLGLRTFTVLLNTHSAVIP